MKGRWFRVPETGTGKTSDNPEEDDPYRPDLDDFRDQADHISGCKAHPDGAPLWIVYVQAPDDVLDQIGSEPGITELPDAPVDALKSIHGSAKSAAEFTESFSSDLG